jgi:hypothetical protein
MMSECPRCICHLGAEWLMGEIGPTHSTSNVCDVAGGVLGVKVCLENFMRPAR